MLWDILDGVNPESLLRPYSIDMVVSGALSYKPFLHTELCDEETAMGVSPANSLTRSSRLQKMSSLSGDEKVWSLLRFPFLHLTSLSPIPPAPSALCVVDFGWYQELCLLSSP